MTLGCCCSSFCKKHGVTGGAVNYLGSPASSTQPYLNSPSFASRVNNDLQSSGSLNANFIYDLKSDGKHLIASCGSSGGFLYKIEEGSMSHKATIGGGHGSGEDQIFDGALKSLGQFWGGDEKGMRYGFDDFNGIYGAEFFHQETIVYAMGEAGVGFYDIITGDDSTLLQNVGAIAYRVGVIGQYILVGTCGYTPPPEPANDFEKELYQPELGTNFPSSKTGKGVLIYDMVKISQGSDLNSSLVKTIPCGNVTDMASDRENYICYVATDSGAFKIEVQENSSGQVNFSKEDFGGGVCTAIDFYKDDCYFTTATNGYSGSLFKNSSSIKTFNTSQNFCIDDSVSCFDFTNFTFYSGAYAAKQVNLVNPATRAVDQTCSVNRSFSTETIGAFPTGVGAGEGGIVVSLWNAGVVGLTLSGADQWEITNIFNQELDCDSWKPRVGGSTDFDINPEYTLACGPVAVGCGQTFVADSVQFNLAGKGPGYYNPMLSKTPNAMTKGVLHKGYGIFSGILHWK